MSYETKVWVWLVLVTCFLSCVLCQKGSRPGGPTTYYGYPDAVKQVLNKTHVNPSSSNNGAPLSNSDRKRIIGGVETARNEFPFIVSFSRNGRHFCGGAIIGPEWVLTAAHCASEPDFDVTAGEHNLDVKEGPEQKSRAVVVIRHGNYNPITYEDDICLVKVSPPFNYDQYVRAFSIPSTHYIASGNATVAGWGTEDEAYQVVSPVLRKVTVPLVPVMQCKAQYNNYFHSMKMICAGEQEGGKDACQGDSGGPLMCDDYHKGATLCGVVSFGLGCARPELAGVYTKVAYYSDWIDYQMKLEEKQGPPQKQTTRHYQYNPPPKVTQPPHNHLPEIPPGYVVIIKPVNQSYVPPPTLPPNPYPHRNRTRGRSASSMLRTSGAIESFLILSCLLFYRFF